MIARLLLIITLAGPALAACSTLNGAVAPSCDGGSRRPLNRSLWDWEGRDALAVAPSPDRTIDATLAEDAPLMRKGVGPVPNAQPFAERPSSARLAVAPVLNIAGSYRTCAS
jgi:type IV secretion system protein VirB7